MKFELRGQEINMTKIVSYSLITGLILISVVVISLKVYFTSHRLEKLVLPQLEKTIGRDLSINNINLKFWPQLGVAVDKMKVANPSGFAEGDVAQLDSFVLAVELIPLLQKRIVIEELILSNLHLKLIKKEDGTTNYKFNPDKKIAIKTGSKDSINDNSNFILNLANLEIKSGQITYNDLANQEKIKINGINSSNKLNLAGKNKKVTTSGQLEVQEIKIADQKLGTAASQKSVFFLEHNLAFNLQDQTLQAEKFDLALAKLNLQNRFKLKLLKDGLEVEDLKVVSGDSRLNIEFLTKSNTKLYFSGQGELKLDQLWKQLALEEKYNLEGLVKTDLMGQFNLEQVPQNLTSLELLGSINVSDLAVTGEGLPGELTETEAKVNLSPNKIEVKELQTSLLNSKFSATAYIKSWRDIIESMLTEKNKNGGPINFAVEVDKLNLNQWQKNFAAVGTETAQPGDQDQNLAEIIPDWPVEGKVKIKKINYQNLIASDFVTVIKSKNDLLELEKLDFQTAQGQITGAGKLDLKANQPRYTGNLKITKLEVNKLLSSLTKFQNKLYGGLNLDLDFAGTSLSLEEILATLTLQGELLINNTKLSSKQITKQLNKYFAVIDNSELKLGKLKGTIELVDGRLKLNKVKTVSDGDQITLNGYSTLAGALDFKIDYLLSSEKSQQIDLKHKELLYAPNSQRIAVALDLSGTATDPKLKWDRSELEQKLKEKAKQKVKAKTKKEKDKIEKKAKEKVKEKKDKAKQKIEEKKEELKDKFKELF